MTYRVNGKTVTSEEWYAIPGKMDWANCEPPMIHSVQPFVSPVDGKVIRSGAELRSHEREHGVVQVGDEYVGLVNEKRAQRRQLQSDMRSKVREAEKNGVKDKLN